MLNQRSQAIAPLGTVYVATDGTGFVKIGWTQSTLEDRLSNIQTDNPREVYLLGTVPNAGKDLEQRLHKRFEQHRARREWFNLAPEIQRFIDGECASVKGLTP